MKRIITPVFSTVIFLVSVFALAQSGGNFEVTKSTIDGGGGASSGGEFSLTGTIGQHDANPQISTGGKFALTGGFWANAKIIDLIFKDSFESD